jgi:hypothetical protein
MSIPVGSVLASPDSLLSMTREGDVGHPLCRVFKAPCFSSNLSTFRSN